MECLQRRAGLPRLVLCPPRAPAVASPCGGRDRCRAAISRREHYPKTIYITCRLLCSMQVDATRIMLAVKVGVRPVMAALLACLLLHATAAAMTSQAGTSRLRTPRSQHAASGETFPATNLHARRLLGSQLSGDNAAAAATLTAPAPAIAQASNQLPALQGLAFWGIPVSETVLKTFRARPEFPFHSCAAGGGVPGGTALCLSRAAQA